jgi:lysozyme
MKISAHGLELIKSFEGYHTRLKNGDCAAYLCPARVPTIGWGCTEGVKLGMVWTEKQAEAALLKEIAKFEEGVNQLITEPMNQNEFDAFVSLAYNIGLAGFKRSSVRGFFNQRKKDRVPKAFELWVRGGGRVLPGLVSRRKREAALFLKPVERPEDPYMPQAVEPEKQPLGPAVTVPVAGATGVAVVEVVKSIASPESATSFMSFASAQPYIVLGVIAAVLLVLYLPKIVPAKWRPA